VLTEHEFDVPLDHGAPDGQRITVFAREAREISSDPKLGATRMIMLASSLVRRSEAEEAGVRVCPTKPAR
jgi:hypothetical protein